jgi:hypothetical protein
VAEELDGIAACGREFLASRPLTGDVALRVQFIGEPGNRLNCIPGALALD